MRSKMLKPKGKNHGTIYNFLPCCCHKEMAVTCKIYFLKLLGPDILRLIYKWLVGTKLCIRTTNKSNEWFVWRRILYDGSWFVVFCKPEVYIAWWYLKFSPFHVKYRKIALLLSEKDGRIYRGFSKTSVDLKLELIPHLYSNCAKQIQT